MTDSLFRARTCLHLVRSPIFSLKKIFTSNSVANSENIGRILSGMREEGWLSGSNLHDPETFRPGIEMTDRSAYPVARRTAAAICHWHKYTGTPPLWSASASSVCFVYARSVGYVARMQDVEVGLGPPKPGSDTAEVKPLGGRPRSRRGHPVTDLHSVESD